MRKPGKHKYYILEIKNEFITPLERLAFIEKRRGRKDPKNFMEDIIENYIKENE